MCERTRIQSYEREYNMKIGDIDKNLAVESHIKEQDIVWYNVKEAPFRIDGLWQKEPGKPFLRLPEDVAKNVSDGVYNLNFHTAGGRIRFTTNTKHIALLAKMPKTPTMPHITWLGQSGFDLYRHDNGHYEFISPFIAEYRDDHYESIHYMDGQWHSYTINMPLYDSVDEVYIGLSGDAELKEPEPYTYEKPVLYYGSSITQGGCASRPGNAYQAVISRKYDCNFINLGFSGSAKGEPAMADYLATIDSSVFVMDYDYNAPTPDHLRATHHEVYRKYREAHPDTPIIRISKPDFRIDSEVDNARRMIVMESFLEARKAGDKRVYFVDGASLFGGEFRDSCTVDGCHPNDLGFHRMAMVIGEVVGHALRLK